MLETLIVGILFFVVLFYGGYFAFALLYGKKVKYRKGNLTQFPTVTFVVPTRNEEHLIQRKIDNMLEMEYPKDKLEIVFVDSSGDKTRQIIEKFMQDSPIEVIMIEEDECRGLASALNRGYATARNEIIIKTDCDMILKKDFVYNIVSYFSDTRVGAVSSTIEVLNQSGIEMGYRSIFHKLRLAEANFDSTYIFNAFAFRRSLVEKIDERSVADDAELALKIRRKGYRTVYAPDAIIYESSPTSIKDRVKQKSRRAQGHVQLALQNADMFLNRRYGRFGMFVFPANFLMILVLPWLILLEIGLISVWLYITIGIISLAIILLFVLFISFIYVKSTPRILAGFIDSQISLLVGSLNLLYKGPKFSWKK